MLKPNLISLPKGPIKGFPLYKYVSARVGYVQRHTWSSDKSLARPDWKNNWKFAIFHPTWRLLLLRRPG